jgi:hypothetical protein
MHPNVGDLILGIKRSLMEEILPAVSTAYAREQLAFAALFCDHIAARWDSAHLFVTAEHDDLRTTLTAAVEIGRRCRTPSLQFTTVLDATEVALSAPQPCTAPSLRVLETAIADMKGSVVRLLEAGDSGDAADAARRAEMRQTLRAYMHRQLGREEEWISTTPIGWW